MTLTPSTKGSFIAGVGLWCLLWALLFKADEIAEAGIAYSALASFRMGMSGSASFQSLTNTWHILRFGLLQEYNIGIGVAANQTQLAAVERPVKVLDLFRLEVGDLLSRVGTRFTALIGLQ
jgi:hypothetical protein